MSFEVDMFVSKYVSSKLRGGSLSELFEHLDKISHSLLTDMTIGFKGFENLARYNFNDH